MQLHNNDAWAQTADRRGRRAFPRQLTKHAERRTALIQPNHVCKNTASLPPQQQLQQLRPDGRQLKKGAAW